MKFLYTIFIGFLCAPVLQAQKITGSVSDDQENAIRSANVMLMRVSDSLMSKITATNSTGHFEFSAIQAGKYFIEVSYVGFETYRTGAIELKGTEVYQVTPIKLEKSDNQLKGVTVVSRKPMIEVKADKTILNVEGTINATGQDALELLRKSPGVLVDKDDNISLSGKNGVQIYIDGKPTPLSGTDLSAYLKSLQSSEIESIEIITNPSARYDAAGNAGIINIRLKKNKSLGTNGSLALGYNVGYTPKYNGSLALNHRDKKVNIFGNYNYSRFRNQSEMILYRDQLDTIFDQKSRMFNNRKSHGFKAGLDYFINRKHTVGILVNGNLTDNSFRSDGKTYIIYKPTGVTDRILSADNSSEMERNNVNFNLNYRFADTLGRELVVDADYGFFRLKGDQLQPNIYYTPDFLTELNRAVYNFISPSDIDIYTLKADYSHNYKKGKLGYGFKTSLVKTDNNFGRYNVYGNGYNKELDTDRSNQFNYSENINAVYINYNRPIKKGMMFQAGVRMENTRNNGDSYSLNNDGSVNYSSESSFERNYTDLFPSAALTFNKNPMKQWTISYSRRIDRPGYQDLNPFEFKLDEYTFQKGNTDLRPQYTNSVAVTHIYKYRLTTTLNFSHVNDVFTQLIDTTENTKAFITKKNLAKQNIVSLNVSYPFSFKGYSMFANLNTFYSHYKADFGGGNRIVNLDVISYNIYMQHSLKFGKKKDWTAELSGFYNAPSIWQGTIKSEGLWSIDGGMQKSLFKGRANLKMSVSDIFKTLQWKGVSDFAGQHLVASGNFESRQFKVNFTYRFGSNQIKAARNRKTGIEDESKRVGQGGATGIQN